MNWTVLVVGLCVVAAIFMFKRMSFVSAAAAETLLKQGALVIDVRNPGEFNSRHIKGALNIPLGEFGSDLPRSVPDKKRVLLLHCLSGARSGIAQRQAAQLGYTTHNLGSYGRAEGIVKKALGSSPAK